MPIIAYRSLFILPQTTGAGTFFISMGLMEMLKRYYGKVAYFKPLIEEGVDEEEIDTILKLFSMKQSKEEACGLSMSEAEHLLVTSSERELLNRLIEKYEELQKDYDFILCVGSSSHWQPSMTSDLYVTIAKNLATPIAGVVDAKNRGTEMVLDEIQLWREKLLQSGAGPFVFFINRADSSSLTLCQDRIQEIETPLFAIPYLEELDRPTVLDILHATGGEVVLLKDEQDLERTIKREIVAAMQVEHFLHELSDGCLVIVPADRSDILLAVAGANRSKGFASASAIVISGDMPMASNIVDMLRHDETFKIAVIRLPYDTIEVVEKVRQSRARITVAHQRKVALALGHFSRYVNTDSLIETLAKPHHDIMTPTMFLYRIFAKARAKRKRIVLPESSDERILKAAEIAQWHGVADIILLGSVDEIQQNGDLLGLDLSDIEMIDPTHYEKREEIIEAFYQLRRESGMTRQQAEDIMSDPTYFATMMLYEGIVDGVVAGATHTTRDTVRPALQIIKTKPGIDLVSSIFFICLDTRVLVYGDCAIVPNPTPQELAQIAIESAETAKAFGVEPIVAMLSYSTGESGVGEDVKRVREATKIAKTLRPDLLIEGPIQYDAAIDPEVGRQKMPQSRVAGYATVFIFPDLNTGNNTYKAVQRATGAMAIGPILQGLRKPVNDLSRGCGVDDIVSTIAITAIQAQR